MSAAFRHCGVRDIMRGDQDIFKQLCMHAKMRKSILQDTIFRYGVRWEGRGRWPTCSVVVGPLCLVRLLVQRLLCKLWVVEIAFRVLNNILISKS